MKQNKKKRSHLFGSFMLCFAMVLLLGAGSVFERAEALKENWPIYDGSLRFIDRNGSMVRGSWLVDDGDLLCTHSRALNDYNEYIIGVSVLEKYMRDRNWNQNLSKRITDQLKGFAQLDLGMPWIFSFSSVRLISAPSSSFSTSSGLEP